MNGVKQNLLLRMVPQLNGMTSLWTDVAGSVNKDRVYGLRVHRSSCRPSPVLSGASTSQSQEEMEAMRKEIVELTQRRLNSMIRKRLSLMRSRMLWLFWDVYYEV
ncbi:hypothetical protein RND71_015673 [Anisodus tanguticus]|uniref:Uncharacterized protein n=1 Tax=Anisodus tanguticus TaxID=243964 RepID=A0AAE1VLB2_9SOLA|nr:hypothetical protein RND71_015673 [Anisodus tanguticus]